eukprot:6467981-Amphidinium_carterae.1
MLTWNYPIQERLSPHAIMLRRASRLGLTVILWGAKMTWKHTHKHTHTHTHVRHRQTIAMTFCVTGATKHVTWQTSVAPSIGGFCFNPVYSARPNPNVGKWENWLKHHIIEVQVSAKKE